MKTNIVPVVIRALGVVTPKLEEQLQQIPGKTSELVGRHTHFFDSQRQHVANMPRMENTSTGEQRGWSMGEFLAQFFSYFVF